MIRETKEAMDLFAKAQLETDWLEAGKFMAKGVKLLCRIQRDPLGTLYCEKFEEAAAKGDSTTAMEWLDKLNAWQKKKLTSAPKKAVRLVLESMLDIAKKLNPSKFDTPEKENEERRKLGLDPL